MSVTLADILAARRVIRGLADATPLVPSGLSAQLGREVLLKLETTQPTGAFKLRGALNAVAALPEGAPGVTCCSTGNHGRSLAFAAARRGLRAVICLSSLVPDAKLAGIRAQGAEVRVCGQSQDDAQAEAVRLCETEGLVDISPFDNPQVIAGQGTIGLELLEARPDLAAILVPLSGGGLAAGIAVAAKAVNPAIRVIGVTMDRGAAMVASIRAGRPVEATEVPSLADRLGGGIGLMTRLSFPLCRDFLDGVVLVTEAEIYRAMQALYWEDRIVAEGASVVGIAALQAGRAVLPEGPVATIVTGRNLDMALFTRVITGLPVRLGDLDLEGGAYAA
jgi:threonine dehydratase